MEKKLILIDMDGTIADFVEAYEGFCISNIRITKNEFADICDFESFKPIDGAIETIIKLSEKYDLVICSTVPTNNVCGYEQKQKWLEKYFGNLFKKNIIFTHRKDLIDCDYMIDDCKGLMQTINCKGDLLKFSQNGEIETYNWQKILEKLVNE
jgi:5'(3')-deoxyribonucleotidase